MKNMLKRSIAMLFVITLISSMLAIPAQAASGSFTGGDCKFDKNAQTAIFCTGFRGDGITKVTVESGLILAPKVTLQVRWNVSGNLSLMNIFLTGGKKGSYMYTLKLWSGSKVLATRKVKVYNNGWW